RVHVVAAQRVQDRGACVALVDQSRLAQDPEVVSGRGLRDRELERDAGLVVVPAGELGDDLATDRVGQRREDRVEGDGRDVGVLERSCHVIPPLVGRCRRTPRRSTPSYPVVRSPSLYEPRRTSDEVEI